MLGVEDYDNMLVAGLRVYGDQSGADCFVTFVCIYYCESRGVVCFQCTIQNVFDSLRPMLTTIVLIVLGSIFYPVGSPSEFPALLTRLAVLLVKHDVEVPYPSTSSTRLLMCPFYKLFSPSIILSCYINNITTPLVLFEFES